MLKLSKTQQKTLHFSIAILGGLLAFATIAAQPATAESKRPIVDLPVIVKTECRQEIDVEICRIYYRDGTWKEVTQPLGTMREGFGKPEKLTAIEGTITGGVYRDTPEAADALKGSSK